MLVRPVAPVPGRGAVARLRARCGEMIGVWEGDQPVPAGEVQYIELEAGRTYRWTEIVAISQAAPELAVEPPDSVRVVGTVDNLDENNILTVSVDGSLLALEVEGSPPPDLAGRSIRVIVDDLQFFPYNL
jgi:hypothetical protein